MPFAWTPTTGLNDTSAFPGPDKNFRAHMQALLDQSRDFINTLENTASLNTSGWFKDKKTGLIIQWGQGTISSVGADTVFPIVFPTSCYVVIPMVWDTGTWKAYLISKSQSAFGSKTDYTGGNIIMLWFAIGR